MEMLSEAQKSALIDAIKDSGIKFEITPALVLEAKDVQWIRGRFRVPTTLPSVVFLFSDDSMLYAKFLNDVLAYPDSKYPVYGFPERNYVEIAAFATDMPDSGGTMIDGLTIADKMITTLQQYVFYYWREMLPDFNAHIEFYTHRIRDDTALLLGTQAYKKVLSFTLITTTSWRFIPPGGTEDELVEEVDVNLDDDENNHPVNIKVVV